MPNRLTDNAQRYFFSCKDARGSDRDLQNPAALLREVLTNVTQKPHMV